MKRKFAVFDIDGTIGRNSIFHQVVDELVDTNVLPSNLRKELDNKIKDYKQRTSINAYRAYTDFAVDTLFKYLENLSVADYRIAVDTVIKRASGHVYVYTRELIADLKKQNYFLIALSGSENYSVEQFTKQFDFDIAIGEQYVVDNGFFTGEVHHVFDRKEKFINQFVSEHELTFDGSIAIGDSLSDSTMLEIVEQPIAFNPEDKLYAEASRRGWKIVIERKNVVYKLSKSESGAYVLND